MRELTIIVPVYNAFSDALECLESVVRHSPGVGVLVVDDASPEGVFEQVLPRYLRELATLRVIRNEQNLGFPATANKALSEQAECDVILLNSDTVVTAGWSRKLQQAAYSRDNVATVTPLTNNGVVCSLPVFCKDNPLPVGHTLDSFATLVERVSVREYPELPTSVGFCMFIRRDALNETGGFDAEAFGAGYGEENDLSCRFQQLGYVDILDDATYIYHKGSCSFLHEAEQLQKKNREVLQRKHPHYFDHVAKFVQRNPLRGCQDRVQRVLLDQYWSERSSVLHILHNGPFHARSGALGGTERHVAELISELPEIAHGSLVPSGVHEILTFHHPNFEYEVCLESSRAALESLLASAAFDSIHLHHFLNHPRTSLLEALQRSDSLIISFHDYALICPRLYLLQPDNVHCSTVECTSACGYSREFVQAYRALSHQVLERARMRVVFSESTKRYLSRVYDEPFPVTQVPHGAILGASHVNAELKHEEPLRIVFLGAVVPHKGGDILQSLIRTLPTIAGRLVEWHIVGDTLRSRGRERVISHGAYQRGKLNAILHQIRPHLALFASRCPETYSFTLDEALVCGIPALVGPLGAPAERVERYGAGWVVPNLSVQAFAAALTAIATAPDELLRVQRSIRSSELLGRSASYDFYRECYTSPPRGGILPSGIIDDLADFQEIPQPQRILRRLSGRVINGTVRVLDSIGVRGKLQSVIMRILPERLYHMLRKLRLSG